MICGDPRVFAIESGITEAYARLSLRALGFFVLNVGGRSYGRLAPASTMLACSFDEVERRIAERGRHTAPFSAEQQPGKIADAFLNAVFADEQEEEFFGISLPEFRGLFSAASKDLRWAPDGDEAFDDGSYVLQFDVDERVRVIAFKRKEGYRHDPGSISDVWLRGDDFYQILQKWRDAFEAEWGVAKKLEV
jgi:hypothetical protein